MLLLLLNRGSRHLWLLSASKQQRQIHVPYKLQAWRSYFSTLHNDTVKAIVSTTNAILQQEKQQQQHQQQQQQKQEGNELPKFAASRTLNAVSNDSQKQQLLHLLSQTASHHIQQQYKIQLCRNFSSKNNNNNNNDKEESNNNLKKDNDEIASSSPSPSSSARTTTIPPIQPDSLPPTLSSSPFTSTSSSFKSREKASKYARLLSVPNYGPDADRAVKSLQAARKERARSKTAKNVRRALYGNTIICAAKLFSWLSSGSSSMMSEFVHSVVDCGNQSLLLMGLRDSEQTADRLHPYGYGKSVYFWALVSALGTFFLGAGISMSHAVHEILHPSLQETIPLQVWSVLALSFVVDGYVLQKTIQDILETKPENVPLWEHVRTIRDPATLAVLLEDGAACLGVVIAICGIGASHYTGLPIFDGMAGIAISTLLGTMGLVLVRVNHRFLLGQAVDREITEGIEHILKQRPSIDNVYSVQSQWTGPETFSFKAEVDFDGTFLAAQLMPRYQGEFQMAQQQQQKQQQQNNQQSHDFDQELQVLLCWYAEDVMRAVEREVRHIEAQIRSKYPGAEYIELEPMSKDSDKFAIDDSVEEKLLMIEKKEMQSFIRVLYKNDFAAISAAAAASSSSSSALPSSSGNKKSKSKNLEENLSITNNAPIQNATRATTIPIFDDTDYIPNEKQATNTSSSPSFSTRTSVAGLSNFGDRSTNDKKEK